jgi:hypothetical protein
MKNQKSVNPVKRVFGEIAKLKSDVKHGFYINDKEVETKVEHVLYDNGKVLTKVYRNSRLCMVKAANS